MPVTVAAIWGSWRRLCSGRRRLVQLLQNSCGAWLQAPHGQHCMLTTAGGELIRVATTSAFSLH